MILAWKSFKAGVPSHQKEAQGEPLPYMLSCIVVQHAFLNKPWEKYVVQNRIGGLVCRLLINYLLSIKENDFSFDKVDDYIIFYGSSKLAELFMSRNQF